MCKATTQIIELRDNSIPPPCPIHGMWGGRMTSCVAMPIGYQQFCQFFEFQPNLLIFYLNQITNANLREKYK